MKTKNIIRILGSKDELQDMRRLVENKKKPVVFKIAFDFNAVIAEPIELATEVFDEAHIDLKEEINRLALYGAIDKYEWRSRYWGTSENCTEIAWFNDGYVKMTSINGYPVGVLRMLSMRFNVIFQTLYSDGKTTGILIIAGGKVTDIKGNSDEADAVFHLIDEPNYTYSKWEQSNKDSKQKKVDMKLLFNYDTEFLSNARKIIDIKNNELTKILESHI